MESKTLYIDLAAIAIISALVTGIVVSASSGDPLGQREVSDQEQAVNNESVVIDETLRRIYGDNATLVIASEDELLGKYEKSDRLFKKVGRRNKTIYWHQRMIDDAIVEGDHRNYQFDKDTKEFKKEIVHWRDDLPEHLPPVIPKEQAESIAGGGSATLYVLSTGGIFQTKQAPKNPCYVVWKTIMIDEYSYYNITIIDAVEGEILGYGVPPPSGGLSFSGPQDAPNCTGVWTDLYQNAESWFESMGYFPTEARIYPNDDAIRKHIQSYETVMFYGVAHSIGDSSSVIRNDCSGTMTADEIHDWIENYPKMPFTFLVSCNAMCDTGPGTLSYEFRKGSVEDTVTVGCCGMSDAPCNQTCWYANARDWQDAMLNYMNQGLTVKEAFDEACDDYLMCEPCVRFAGDPNFKVVPVVGRGPVAIAKSDFTYNSMADKIMTKAYFNGTDSYDLGGTITDWSWRVDDGTDLAGEIAEHLFEVPMYWQGDQNGHYVPAGVTLTVTDDSTPPMDNSTTMEVTVWIGGDANGDGVVNIGDSVMVGYYWGGDSHANEYADRADLNNDGIVNIGDTIPVGYCWGHTAW